MSIPRLSHALVLLTATALMTACATRTTTPDEARIWRAAITDPQAKSIRVWDLGEREEVAVFKTQAPAQLHPGLGSAEFISVEKASGEVRLLHLGLKQEDHGDHSHWIAGKPSFTLPVLLGPRPAHANAGVGQLAIFFDGDGVVRRYTPTLNPPLLPERAAARDHHGIGVPLSGARLLLSRPAVEGRLPEGMHLLDANGKIQVTSPPCSAQHGDGHQGQLYLFGCDNGLLLYNDQTQAFELLPYPADSGKRLVRKMISTPKAPLWVADFGKEALLLIDLAQRTQRVVPLPTPLLDANWDTGQPEQVFALLHSGELLSLDTRNGAVLRRTALLPAWNPPENSSTPTPHLAVAANRIAVVDPRSGLLHFVRASDLKPLEQIALGGQPVGIVMRSVNLDAD
jgi:hypothetical protein